MGIQDCMLWYIPEIPELGRMRQGDYQPKTILAHAAKSRLA